MLADLVSLDTPVIAMPIGEGPSAEDLPLSAAVSNDFAHAATVQLATPRDAAGAPSPPSSARRPPPPPPPRPPHARAQAAGDPSNDRTLASPLATSATMQSAGPATVAAPPAPSSLAANGGPPIALPPPIDFASMTAPMSSPPRSAVTPVPADATIAAETNGAAHAERTVLGGQQTALVPERTLLAGEAPPTRTSEPALQAPATDDPALAKFEAFDRWIRPNRLAAIFALGIGIPIAEAFDSAIGSFPIFRTVAASFFLLGGIAMVLGRLAATRGDEGGFRIDESASALSRSASSFFADLRAFAGSTGTHRRRLVGRFFFALGLFSLATWSLFDLFGLVLSDLLHAWSRAAETSGHSTIVPATIMTIGAALLYAVAREERGAELRATKEALRLALPLHASPLDPAQLAEQSRLFPAEYQPLLGGIAAFRPEPLPTEQAYARALELHLARRLEGTAIARDVPIAEMRDARRGRAHMVVGGTVIVDVVRARTPEGAARGVERLRAHVRGSGDRLVVMLVVDLVDPAIRDTLAKALSSARERAPALGVRLVAT